MLHNPLVSLIIFPFWGGNIGGNIFSIVYYMIYYIRIQYLYHSYTLN